MSEALPFCVVVKTHLEQRQHTSDVNQRVACEAARGHALMRSNFLLDSCTFCTHLWFAPSDHCLNTYCVITGSDSDDISINDCVVNEAARGGKLMSSNIAGQNAFQPVTQLWFVHSNGEDFSDIRLKTYAAIARKLREKDGLNDDVIAAILRLVYG
jgi:hypothetical protein